MRQIIPFVKDISFNTRVSEITSIALEHNLQMENGDSLVGSFEVSGNYKINDVSVNEENFNYDIPFDITLDDKYDATKVTIDIDDFYYEIINDAILRVHIDVLADNLVYAPKEEPKEEILIEEALTNEKSERGEEVPGEREIPKLSDQIIEMPEEVKEEIKEIPRVQENITEEIKNSLAANFLADDEKYVTYKVHIVRENETIETIKETYNVTIEEIEKYNAIDNIMIGTKLLIPTSSNEQ